MIISKTPFRISFVGGGTDINSFYKQSDGKVINCAINKFIYVIIKERYDKLIYLNSMVKEIVDCVDDIKHELVRESLKKSGIKEGVEITILSDIPSKGSGLGSSSSLTVGLLNAFFTYQGNNLDAETLAKFACEIEIDILKKPIGKQDQYIAAYGGIRKFVFKKNEDVNNIRFNLSESVIKNLNDNLFLHFTNITRSADKILKSQKENKKTNFLKLKRLAKQADIFENHLENEKFDVIGDLLRENWEIKKELAVGINNPEIDKMTKLADDSGVIGYKIAGAGGGGFLLSYVRKENQEKFSSSLKNYKELIFQIENKGSRIILNI